MIAQYPKFIFLIALLTNAFLSCGQPTKKISSTDSLKRNWDQTIPGNFSKQSQHVFDSTQIDRFFEKYPKVVYYERDVRTFYRNRSFSYAWFENGLLIEQAGNLSNRLLNLENEGVFKHLSYQLILDSLLSEATRKVPQKVPDIMLELMLTSEYFVFSKLAWDGMNPSVSKTNKWYLPRKSITYDDYLDSLLKGHVTLPDEPVYRQYELLREYLRKYKILDAEGNWPKINTDKKSLKIGDNSLIVLQIKKRLSRLEDYKGDTLNSSFDNELTLALKRFQQRNGINDDGLLNKETITELNIPLKTKLKQILVNMERSRWLPVTLTGDYLAVNIPEFKLHVYRADSLLWSCNAVVGQTVHPTTQFYGEIKYVVFSPYWNIPPGILRNEVLPGMRRNSNYLANHNMEITGYSGGRPVVRQKPGPSNALGLVKFLFPNNYNIYLHDTPSKSLFKESARAFSHGCIRIEEPAKLAAFLLRDTGKWDSTAINTAMKAGKERYVTLENKIPVFIAYFTAFTDREGRLNFRKDIYNLDARLASMIISGEGVY